LQEALDLSFDKLLMMMILSGFFPSSKCSLFHNSNVFGSFIIHILYTECAKIKKENNSGAKRITNNVQSAARSTESLAERIYLQFMTTAAFRALYMCTFYPKLLLATAVHSTESELKRFAWLVVSAT